MVATAVLLTLPPLFGCGHRGLDDQQADEEARTCASLVERVEARALLDDGWSRGDGDEISPRGLAEDPEAFYRALQKRLGEARFGPTGGGPPVSPASVLVARCGAATR